MSVNKETGQRLIQDKVHEKGVTQKELAIHLNISESSFTRKFSPRYHDECLNEDEIQEIASYLDTDAEWKSELMRCYLGDDRSSNTSGRNNEVEGEQVPLPWDSDLGLKALLTAQKRFLEVWRLFNFDRDIYIEDVYVDEVLEDSPDTGILLPGLMKTDRKHERTVLERVIEPLRSDTASSHIIEGQAGSGKTTMLRNWSLKLAANQQEPRSEVSRSPTPIYLALRNLAISETSQPSDFVSPNDLAECFVRTIPGTQGYQEVAYHLFEGIERLRTEQYSTRDQITYPEFVLLCDGLDELAADARPKFLHWVQGLPQSVKTVITTRPAVLNATGSIPRSKFYLICNFGEDQIHQFIGQWFSGDESLGNQFALQIDTKEKLARLAVIPLLLTCLSIDVEVRQDAVFPDSFLESELIRRVMVIILDQWDAAKAGRPVNHDLVRIGIDAFARIVAQHDFGSTVCHEELVSIIRKSREVLGISEQVVEQFIQRVNTSGRILIGTPERGYTFAHKVFYDFFYSEALEHMFSE